MYMYDSLHVHGSQFFMHGLPSTSVHVSDCCSIYDLIFWVSFLFLFCLFIMCYHVSRLHGVCTYHLNNVLLLYALFFTLYLYAIKFIFYSSFMQFGDQSQIMQIFW